MKHNFGAGPCILPQEVFKQASQGVLEFNNTGLSILEISHRAPEFVAVMDEAITKFRSPLLGQQPANNRKQHQDKQEGLFQFLNLWYFAKVSKPLQKCKCLISVRGKATTRSQSPQTRAKSCRRNPLSTDFYSHNPPPEKALSPVACGQ